MSADAPYFILVAPQLGENIGMCARALLNCGFDRLRLVSPRDGWPNPAAGAACAGANAVLDAAGVFADTRAAVADLHTVYAATARGRRVHKPVLSLEQAVRDVSARGGGARTGILFGAEKSGLSNADVSLADAILTIAVNPAFSSLNVSHSVALTAYAFSQGRFALPPPDAGLSATKAEILFFLERLETGLEDAGFFYPPEKKEKMVLNLRALFQRAAPSPQEIQTLHGVLTALSGAREKN